MAASHRVLPSPSTYICVGVPLSLDVTSGRLPWLPPLFAFCPHLLFACFAVNWHLPCILNIGYRQFNSTLIVPTYKGYTNHVFVIQRMQKSRSHLGTRPVCASFLM